MNVQNVLSEDGVNAIFRKKLLTNRENRVIDRGELTERSEEKRAISRGAVF